VADPLPESTLPADQRERDLGWMLHDIVAARRLNMLRYLAGVSSRPALSVRAKRASMT
jgi:CRISPR-associated protein Cas5d